MESAYAETLPMFRDVQAEAKQELFIKKVHLCSHCFDFTNTNKNIREKEIKRQTLLELVDYVNSQGSGPKFTEHILEDVTNMIAANLFRALPVSAYDQEGVMYDPEEEEPALDPAWPHLQIVYEFLFRFVVSTEIDAKTAKKYVDTLFVLKLIELFDSEDPRERDFLKTILHRIYGKFMVHRPFIRKAINNIFFRFLYETERHSGIAELLEILGSIINGFALPLKEEHKTFLSKALIPLHKPKCVAMYHQPLNYCLTQFVEKDNTLAEIVVQGVLKYWPQTSSSKEVLFLSELEEILELTQPPEFEKIVVPLFARISRSLSSPHFQVAERALFLWNNDQIVRLVAGQIRTVMPVVYPALEESSRSHWNQAVHSLTGNVKNLLKDLDEHAYLDCERSYEQKEMEAKEKREKRAEDWKRIEAMAKAAAA